MTLLPAEAGLPVVIITLNEDGTGTFGYEGEPAQDIKWVAYGSDTLALLAQPGDVLAGFLTISGDKLIIKSDDMTMIFEIER